MGRQLGVESAPTVSARKAYEEKASRAFDRFKDATAGRVVTIREYQVLMDEMLEYLKDQPTRVSTSLLFRQCLIPAILRSAKGAEECRLVACFVLPNIAEEIAQMSYGQFIRELEVSTLQ